MTDLWEFQPYLHWMRWATAVIAVIFLAGPLVGSMRLITSDVPIVRWFSLSMGTLFSVLIIRTIWSAFVGQIHDVMGLALNLLMIFAGFASIRYLLLGIPEDERHKFNMFTASFYPPWDMTKVLLYLTDKINWALFWRR